MLEAATEVLRIVKDEALPVLDECDSAAELYLKLDALVRADAFVLDLHRMEGLQGVSSLSLPPVEGVIDMTPQSINGVPCYTRKQFAHALDVTPQRVGQLLNFNRNLLRVSAGGKIFIPCTELERRHEWAAQPWKKKGTPKAVRVPKIPYTPDI